MDGIAISLETSPALQKIKPIKAGKKVRLSGNTRYQTAVDISKSGWSQSDNVILVNGTDFPDALVGSSFAYLKDAPILLTLPKLLDSSTKAEIERLGAKNIYILGSTASVSENVENELRQRYNVARIGGAAVLDTAVKIGEEIRKTRNFDTVAIATQENFPDALAIAPYSARNTMPILFTEKNILRAETKKALQDWGIKEVIISGGTGVVSTAVENELQSMGLTVTRLGGDDRYATALKIIRYFEDQNSYSDITVATGLNYPDALTGAVFAAKNNIPLVLVNKSGLTDTTAEYLNSKKLEKAYIFGGDGVVSDDIIIP
jgi:putative cell wall-binding protein